MPALRQDVKIDRGATFTLSVQFCDSNEVPVDLTGWSANFIIVDSTDTPVFTKAATVTADGWINTKVTDEETAIMATGKRSYHLDLQNPGGDIIRLVYGSVTVRSGVVV